MFCIFHQNWIFYDELLGVILSAKCMLDRWCWLVSMENSMWFLMSIMLQCYSYWALSYYSELTQSQAFQPMAAQLSMKDALPLAKILATAPCNSSNTGPRVLFQYSNCLSSYGGSHYEDETKSLDCAGQLQSHGWRLIVAINLCTFLLYTTKSFYWCLKGCIIWSWESWGLSHYKDVVLPA